MAKIAINTLLDSTDRKIRNLKNEFVTSDGPSTSSFLSLSDLGIPYDSYYISRVIVPADTTDYVLNYGLLENITFLLIKVTYNGNYDHTLEDDFDPLYRHEENTYNITYYYEGNSGKTYPIGRLLILNGSVNNKLEKIYINNPLDYDVSLHILQANTDLPRPLPPSSAITISNLYYNDIITNQVSCGDTGTTTTTTSLVPTTTTTTTTTILKNLMSIIKSIDGEYYKYTATGDTMGLFDYYKNEEWVLAGEDGYYMIFTNLTNIIKIRFYFELNDTYYGTLKTDYIEPIDHNTGLYFVDIDTNGNYIPYIGVTGSTSGSTSGNTSGCTSGDTFGNFGTGSTCFIINHLIPILTGYTVINYVIPYSDILSIQKALSGDTIYLYTSGITYILKFLTTFDFDKSYSRMTFAFYSYLYPVCRYLTEFNAYENGIIVII